MSAKEARIVEWQQRCEDALIDFAMEVAGTNDWRRVNWIEMQLRDGRPVFECSVCGKKLPCVAYCHEHVRSNRHFRRLELEYPHIKQQGISLRECPMLLPALALPPSPPSVAACKGASVPSNPCLLPEKKLSEELEVESCTDAPEWTRPCGWAGRPSSRVASSTSVSSFASCTALTASHTVPSGFLPAGCSHEQGSPGRSTMEPVEEEF